jgi:hypothetical protein
MFDKTYEHRLQSWHDFREQIESEQDPIQFVIDNYEQPPTVSMHTDPWTPEQWPSPWELIQENQYCEFCKLLGICYSLQLTDKFSQANFEIHIGIDKEESKTYYLLFVDDIVIGYLDETYVHRSKLSENYYSQQVYPMPKLN